jgi:hypothetical protein
MAPSLRGGMQVAAFSHRRRRLAKDARAPFWPYGTRAVTRGNSFSDPDTAQAEPFSPVSDTAPSGNGRLARVIPG